MITPGVIIEGLVVILLLVTIGYCMALNKRLRHLRADEATLRVTIAELITATEIAERAIIGLRSTASESEELLTERLQNADAAIKMLDEQLSEGDDVVRRLGLIVSASRPKPKLSEAKAMGTLTAANSSDEQLDSASGYRRLNGAVA